MELQELKNRALASVDKNADRIIAIGESIFAEPELGYKEFKTAEKVKQVFRDLGYCYTDGHAITGVIATAKGKESKIKIAVMGELDAVVAPGHRCADPLTGAAHSCGHFAQIATMLGVAMALKESGVMIDLSGDVVFMAVPSEEAVELEYRNSLIQAGKISFLGGKQEFIKLGLFDDIDMMMMQHTMIGDTVTSGGPGGMGFVAKIVHYIGKEAHAASPDQGINALNAAKLGLTAIDAIRDTFKDEDGVRVHPIITKGGNLVNVVPADVHIETFVRARSYDAIKDASFKVNRALKAGADALGAEVNIFDIPGYMLSVEEPFYKSLFEKNLEQLVPADKIKPGVGFTTDASDVSNLIPTIHATFGGAAGIGHSSNYEIEDKNLAYIIATKAMVMTVIDLLADDAANGIKVKESFHAPMTKEQYLRDWGKLSN